MTLALPRLSNYVRDRISSVSFRAFEGAKRRVHTFTAVRPQGTIFIFGCQRSGTTHLERLFRSDPRSVVFGEFSALSIDLEKTVWRPLPELRRHVEMSEGRYAVVRSLLASHRARDALEALPNSVAVWVFRDPQEVVSSMMRKWHADFEEISRLVETDDHAVWELEGLWTKLNADVAKLSIAAPGSDAYLRDIYGLYWASRNAAFFEHGLEQESRIVLLDYRTLLSGPGHQVNALIGAIGSPPSTIRFPLKTGRVNAKPKSDCFFSPAVQKICDDMLWKLREAEVRGK